MGRRANCCRLYNNYNNYNNNLSLDILMSDKAIACPLPLNMQHGTVSAALKVPGYKFMVIDTGVCELYLLLCHQCLQSYLQFFKKKYSQSQSLSVCIVPYISPCGAVQLIHSLLHAVSPTHQWTHAAAHRCAYVIGNTPPNLLLAMMYRW